MRQRAKDVDFFGHSLWGKLTAMIVAVGLIGLWWALAAREGAAGVQTFTQTLKPKEFFKWDAAIERLTLPKDGAPFEVCLTGEGGLVCIKSDLLGKLLAVMLTDDGASTEHGILPLPDPRSMIMR